MYIICIGKSWRNHERIYRMDKIKTIQISITERDYNNINKAVKKLGYKSIITFFFAKTDEILAENNN